MKKVNKNTRFSSGLWCLMLSMLLTPNNLLTAQGLCVDTPTNALDFAACNRDIAATFAPIIEQGVTTDTPGGLGGNADRIVPFDFDGDWSGFNNWDNASTPADPVIYYHVHWSETFWTITYSIYWARDFSNLANPLCLFDAHEGDSDRIIIVVERPTSENTDPTTLATGMGVTHHGDSDLIQCLNDYESIDDENPFISENATHPVIVSTAGSHALYHTWGEANGDIKNFHFCQPTAEVAIIYQPGTVANRVPINSVFSTTETYRLEDVLADGGLWDHRYDEDAFPEWAEFACDNFNCKGGDGLAAAPWNGSRGTNPLCWFEEQSGNNNYIHCECRADSDECDPVEVTCEDTVYNPFACPDGDPILELTPSAPDLTVCQLNDPITFSVTNSDGPAPEIQWVLPEGFSIVPSPPGTPTSQITIQGSSAVILGPNTITAYSNLAPCFSALKTTFNVVQDIYIDFHTEDNNAKKRHLFCPGELVRIDAEGITGEQAYRIKLFSKPFDSNDNYSLENDFGWITGEMDEWFNLTQFAIDNGHPLNYMNDYKVKIIIQGDCPNLDMTQSFSFVQEYGYNELASIEVLNENHEASDVFCTNDLVFADGSGSYYYNTYELFIFRRPIGSTDYFDPFYTPLTSNTNGPVGVLNLNQLIAQQDLVFDGGYEYEVELRIHGTCFGTRVARDYFSVYYCIGPVCETPENLGCSSIEGNSGTILTWNTIVNADTYLVEINASPEIASVCGCREAGNTYHFTATVNTPFYQLSNFIVDDCFEWRVQAICGTEENQYSDFSEPICYRGKGVCDAGLRQGKDKEQTIKSVSLKSKIFPNPSTGDLTVELNAPETFTLLVNIYNIQGQLIKTIDKGEIEAGVFKEKWSTANYLEPGLYIFDIQTSLGNLRKKVTITK